MGKHFWIALVLILVGITARFIFLIDGESILPNFSPIGAIAIFGAAYLKGAQRFIIPLGVYWVSDLLLNNLVYSEYYETFQLIPNFWIYGAFILAGIVAYFLLKQKSVIRLVGASVSAAVLFFVITNFGVWAGGTMYPMNSGGLMACYIAGIPFFWNTIIGNLFYGFVLFGAYEWFTERSFISLPLLSTPQG